MRLVEHTQTSDGTAIPWGRSTGALGLCITIELGGMSLGRGLTARPAHWLRYATEAVDKLGLAGADRIVSPQTVGARRIAAMALDPNLARFVDLVVEGDTVELRIEQLTVPTDSPLAGSTLRSSRIRERSGATIVAIEASSNGVQLNPDPDRELIQGDVLVALGTREHIEALNVMLAASGNGR